jgi:amidohydrolase
MGRSWEPTVDHLTRATQLRHALHRAPELSGQEQQTAQTIVQHLRALDPDDLITGLGGTGVAASFGTGSRCLMIRCELDALPIYELSDLPYKSQADGIAHLCGHDGHMAILYTVAQSLSQQRPDCRVVLLFQPAEETGAGARAVMADPRYADLRPDMAISLHNLPGIPLGSVVLGDGPINCASRGLKITLRGRTAHASQPETGQSPGLALAQLIPALGALSNDAPVASPNFRLATVTHAKLGEPSFGVAPGTAALRVTLRTLLDQAMEALESETRALVDRIATGFGIDIEVHDAFGHCINAPQATALLDQACADMPRVTGKLPFRFSEDFGLYGRDIPGAMLFLGSGESCPDLHNPDYDFPDALIGIGANLFLRAISAFEAQDHST